MATRVIAAQDKTSSGAGDDVQIKAGSANTSGAGGSIIIQPGSQVTTGGDGFIQVKSAAGVNSGKIQGSAGDLKIMPESGKNVLIYDGYNGGGTNVIFQTNQAGSEPRVNMPLGVSINSFNFISGTVYAGNYATLTAWNLNLGFRGAGYAVQSGITGGNEGVLRVTAGDFTAGGSVAYASSTPTALSTNPTNDLVLTGSAFQRLSSSSALALTGIAPPATGSHVDGRLIWLYNVGSFNITLKHSQTSTAGNQFVNEGSGDIVLGPNRVVQAIYDSTSSRWRVNGETYPYVFPTADGTNGQVLTTNGSGTLSWTTVTSGGTVSGTTNYIAKFTGSTAVGNSLIYDDGSNVGIGTTSAQGRLDVVGANVYEPIRGITSSASNLESGANNALGLSVNNSNTTAGNGIAIGFNTATTNSTLYGVGAIGFNNLTHTTLGVPQGKFQVITRDSGGGLTPKLTIDTSGNLGIGTASPDTRLHIYHAGQPPISDSLYASMILDTDSATNFQRIRFDVGATPYWGIMREGTTNNFVISGRINGSWSDTPFVITPSGNVGIGTASPSNNLSIGASAGKIGFQRGSGDGEYALIGYKGTTGNDIYVFEINNTSGTGELRLNQGGTYNPIGMTFYTNNAEKMRIDSAGNVGIGTASPGAQLQVTSSAAATKGLIVKGAATQSANLTEWQDSTGTVVAAVSPTGAFTGSSFTPYGTFNSTTTIFGNNYWTPNYTGGVTSPSAGTYTKSTGNANTWDGQVYSSEGYTKNVYCAARASQTNGYIMFGLNSDPTTNADYGTLDYAWYFRNDGILQIYESGGAGSTYGAYTTSTVLSITYDGSNVQYWKDGVIQRTVARSTGNPLYFDTSFYTLSSSLNSVQFGPIGQPFGISGTSGYLPKFTSQQTLGNSIVYDNGTNVGIGTASPTSKLDVSTGTGANFRAAFAATNQVEIGNYSAASGYREIAVAGSQVYFQTNTAGSAGVSTRMLIDPSGNVGIGTTSPGAKLEIQTADGADSLALSGYKTMKWESNNHLVFGGYTAGQWQVLKFYTNGSERVRVTSGGLVGIGTSTIAGTVPLADLHVNDPSGYGSLQLSQSPYGATIDTGGEIQFAATYRSAYDLTQVARIRGLRENATNNNWAGYLAFYTSTGTDNPSASTERMRINSSGNVGVGTASPLARLDVRSSSAYNASSANIAFFASNEAQASNPLGLMIQQIYSGTRPLVGLVGTRYGLSGNDIEINGDTSGVGKGLTVQYQGNVGVGTASPGAKLQVDTGATGTKGQIIKAFLGQTANLSEWQNSTGTVLSAIDNNGRLVISSGGGTTSTPDLYLNNTSTTSPIIKWNSITGNPGMWFVSNNSIICKMYDNGIVEAGNTLAVQDMYLRAWSLQRASAGIISFNGSGPAISVGAGTLTTADSTMQITPPAASKKGLVVSGAALQTGNLQEWQNNSGTALAYMDASGNIITTSRVIAPVHSSSSSLQLWHADNTADSASNGISFGYSNWGSSYMPTNWTFKRTLPNTSGDYVELFSLPGQQASHFELTVVAYKHAEAFESKSYTFATQYLTGGGILQPTFSHSRNPGFAGFFGNHFEVELNTNVEPAVVRVRRTSTSGTNVAIFAYLRGMHISGITEKAGTGTSSISLSSLHGTQQVFPTVIAPPAVSSGAGNNIGLYAGNGVTSGAGGSIILQPGAQATSGGHGKVISRPGGSGQNYHEFQSSGGSTHVFVDYSGRLCITPEVNTTSMPVDCGLFVTPRQNANTIGLVVRGIASQAGNLQQWQNSAGTVLTSVDSVGRIGVETAPDSNYSVKAAGRIYAGNDIVTTAGLVTRSGAFDFTFGYGGPYLRRGYSSNGSTLYFGEDAAYQPAFDFSLGVAMPTIGVMRVTASAANTRALVLKAAASPTANLQEWQNSSGTALAYMDGNGNFAAVTKSFLIDHPTPAKAAEGKKLRYASLEGPENGVYYRGRLEGESEIVLPDYWKDLVDPESITVNLTARKFAQPSLFVVDANAERVVIESDRQICCDFTVFATRKDVAKLEVEPDGN